MVSTILDIISIIFIFFLAGGLMLTRIFLFTDKEELQKYGQKTFFILGIITLILMVIGVIVYLLQ